jgi:hypothetical protein
MLVIFSGWYAYSEQGGVVQIYKNTHAPFDDEKKVDSVLVIPDKTVLVKTKYQGGLFWTETRKEKIERFKCRLNTMGDMNSSRGLQRPPHSAVPRCFPGAGPDCLGQMKNTQFAGRNTSRKITGL